MVHGAHILHRLTYFLMGKYTQTSCSSKIFESGTSIAAFLIIGVQVTGCKVILAYFIQGWSHFFTHIKSSRTSWMKTTANGGTQQAGWFPWNSPKLL